MKDIIINSIIELSKNKNYLYRITAIQSLNILKDTINQNDL